MTNAEIAAAFEELGLLYELDGADRYRVLAYAKAAKVIGDSPVSVAEMAREGRVTELPGIGKTLEEKIKALLADGEIPAAAKLKESYPEQLLEVTRVPGLGAKTVRRLHEELGVSSLDDLHEVAEKHQIQTLKGLGAKVEEKVLTELAKIEAAGDAPSRKLLSAVLPIAEQLASVLRGHPAAERVEIAGSARRLTETCKDVDLIAASDDPVALATFFAGHELIGESGKPGENGVRAETHSGLWVDLRIVDPESFGNLLQHFTGSKEHNVELREDAVAQGLSVSEHGIKETGSGRVAKYETEEKVYERLGYEYIEPELREARGELAAAREGRLPKLIEMSDIRGDLHVHTTLSDGQNTLEEMADAARERGYGYLAITDHSLTHGFGDNVEPERLWERIEEIREFNRGSEDFHLLAGSEINIGLDGTLDYDDDLVAALDWSVASIHTAFSNDEDEMTARILAAVENPLVDCIGHMTGRLLLRREPYPLDVEAIFEAAARTGTMIEINANPNRRDLSEQHARLAAEAGVMIAINTDAHNAEGLDLISYGIATARRGWLTAGQVANTRGWEEFSKLRKRAR